MDRQYIRKLAEEGASIDAPSVLMLLNALERLEKAYEKLESDTEELREMLCEGKK
jgi:hypothetical protein